MWKKVLKIAVPLTLCLILAVTAFTFSGCGKAGTTATEIVIGASRDITGPQAGFQEYGAAPMYKMWIEEVNAAGGLDVGGTKLTIRLIEYDDASDTAVCIRNIEKLCTEDNVDFLFGPTGTAMLFAAAPIANKNKKIMVCGEGGATTLESKLSELPYIFSALNYSNHFQMPMFASLCAEKGATTAYICFMNDLHGAEYNTAAQGAFALEGISVVDAVSIPISITDLNSVVQSAKAYNADIFCMFAYPNQNILLMQTLLALDFSPKVLLIGPGCNFEFFNLTFGAALEGVCGEGAWNAKSSAGAATFAAKATEAVGLGNMDWWGGLVYYSAAQFLGMAIEKAGTLDNEVVREIMYTEKFETAMGTFYWERYGENGGCLLPQAVYAGQIGQWQNGIFEVIDNDTHNTASMIYPKPDWPAN